MDRYRLCLLLAIMLSNLRSTHGDCLMTEQPNRLNICSAILECEQVIAKLDGWHCIKHVSTNYNYYDRINGGYRKDITYDTNYILEVNVKNVDDEHDIFENARLENIIKFRVDDGHISIIPENVYHLSQATEIGISNTQISTVNLNKFVTLSKLTNICLKNNTISTLDMEKDTSILSSSIEVVDLSRNVLKMIPDNCFSLYTHMQHLNLSYNMIRSFNILTFEGVSQLITLDVSHNLLFEIENSFTRFMNLKDLYLENNELTKVLDYNLNTLIKLEKLNLSSNKIDKLESNTFKNLLFLEIIDISNNKIDAISNQLFEKNSNLHYVSISNNRIKHIESGAFKGKNITTLNLKYNNISGNIEKETFSGIHVSKLDLSNGSITSLGNDTFINMCSDLLSINVSFNALYSLSYSAFTCLSSLTVLDLSHNKLENLNFEKSSLKNLSKLYVHNNGVKKITKHTFKDLNSLEYLNLSFNDLTEIEPHSFEGLEKVEILSASHSPFVNTMNKDIFDGMKALKTVDLSFTRTSVYENESFSGLADLEGINLSFGQLSNLAYNAFIRTGSILELDLSHNLLDNFYINTSSIPKIQILYLNDNKIRNIDNNTFSDLKALRILNLSNNIIQRLEPFALRSLEKLGHLYLSHNAEMLVIGSPFDNLKNLYQVKLDNVKTRFTFENTKNVEIKNLDMHSCGIKDINKLFIFKVCDLLELNLSANKIMTIDKFSFQTMRVLVTLDLSSNIISFIQPGSFLHTSELKTLSLFDNNLQTLQFGVFDGIKALTLVNLSSNALRSFDAKLLPVALTIALDNNDIAYLNFKEIFESNINILSIGGNQISCKILIELKTSTYSEHFKKVIKTAKLDYHSENVDGISCQSLSKDDAVIIPASNNNTGYDIRKMLVKFTNAIENLRSSIDVIRNNTKLAGESSQKNSDVTELVKYIKNFTEISNQTHLQSNEYFENMKNVTNTYKEQLEDIKEYLFNLTSKMNGKNVNTQIDSNSNEKYLVDKLDKTNVKYDDIRSEMKQMLNKEIYQIREELGKLMQNSHKPDPISLPQIANEGNSDKILYFIAASLGIIVTLYIINAVYSYVRWNSRRISSFNSSSRPITSEIEME